MNEKIPVPITFNTYKHHFGFLQEQIKIWQTLEWEQVEPELYSIGENLIDLYTGDMTVDTICNECLSFFHAIRIEGNEAFSNWLYPKAYKKIKLPDSSEWIIKYGKIPERYIHIHPAKKSIHTTRVRANTLKTVLALMAKSIAISQNSDENLHNVNYIRTEYLQISPIKNLQHNKGIMQLWNMFSIASSHTAIELKCI